MKIPKFAVGLVVFILSSIASGQGGQRYIVLPQSAGHLSFNLFEEDTRLGTWQPSKADIDGLETSLPQISGLHAANSKFSPTIEHPEAYFRQYIGATVSQSRLIYVNAFCGDTPPSDWKEHLYVVMDGGTCFWQAFYDPVKKSFSNLTINGRA
jgi:hypothetical protein